MQTSSCRRCAPASKDHYHPSVPEDPPIDRLPPELLWLIFTYCLRAVNCGWQPPYIKVMDEMLFRIMHICRKWHNIPINCPSLWSIIKLGNPIRTTHFLAHSQNAALIVHLGCRDCEEELQCIAMHSSRIRTIFVDRYALDSFLKTFHERETPFLHRLIISAYAENDLVAPFTLRGVSSLQELSIHGSRIRDYAVLSTLTSQASCLTSLDLFQESGPVASMTSLIALLEDLKELKELRLDPIPAVFDASPNRRVTLSGLTRLTFDHPTSLRFYKRLLEHFNLPDDVTITLTCQQLADDLASVSQSVGALFNNCPAHSVSLSREELSCSRADVRLFLRLGLQSYETNAALKEILQAIIGAIPSISGFTANHKFNLDSQYIRKCHAVNDIWFDSLNREFFHAVFPDFAHGFTWATKASLPFPSLQNLTFSQIDFVNEPSEGDSWSGPRCFDMLIKALKARQSIGLSLSRLHIMRSCALSAEQKERLTSVATNVWYI